VMCSYNKVNGDWACENDYLLNHVLKTKWNYPGFVVSDWEATHSVAKAANAGLDMEMPNDDYFGQTLLAAVKKGEVTQARLDNMVHRVLRSMFEAGIIDNPPVPRYVVDPFRGRDDAQHIAEESIVLLRNERNVLPLDATKVRSIAVIGAHADIGVLSGGGSAQVDAPGGNNLVPDKKGASDPKVYFPSSPLKYIREHVPDATVVFDEGTDLSSAIALAKRSQVAIVFAEQHMAEGRDSVHIALPDGQDELIRAISHANPNTIVVLETGNPVAMPWIESVAGVMEAWYPGIGGGQAIANLLFGAANPSAKLPITFARSEVDLPHPRVFGVDGDRSGTSLSEYWADTPNKASFPAHYSEGARVGYKWFDSERKTPLFPFGYGLSYTTFRYSDLQVDAVSHTATFTLENTGSVTGTEIAELYVQLPSNNGEDFRRLAGWKRVSLKPGQRSRITISIEPLAAASFNDSKDEWMWLHGQYRVFVGGSSRNLPLTGEVALY